MKQLFFILLFSAVLSVSATTYYIDPTGNDATGTGAIGSPWKTLFKATSTVTTSGDIIHVNAGTYLETAQIVLLPGVSIEGTDTTTVTGLSIGTYIFRLTVTDNLGATGYDEVTIIITANGRYIRRTFVNF